MTYLVDSTRECWILTDEALFGDVLGNALETREIFDSTITVHPQKLKANLFTADTEPEMLILDADSYVSEESFLRTISIVDQYLPESKLVLFSPNESWPMIPLAIQNGVRGVAYKSQGIEEIEKIIAIVREGNASCPPGIAQATLKEIRRLAAQKAGQIKSGCQLTKREVEILEYVAHPDRLANKEIARALGLSVSTIKNHLHNIFEKLEVSTRQAAVRNAIAHGFLGCMKDKVFASVDVETNA